MVKNIATDKPKMPTHGWLGLSLVVVFWILNWSLLGTRTNWGFFPLWLGYCLSIDGLVFRRTGTSLLTRSWRKYIGLFLISAPVWWLFEWFNLHTQNWIYLGTDSFTPLQYVFWTTLSFSTVIPAVFGSAEFVSSFGFLERLKPGPIIGADKLTVSAFFIFGWVMLVAMLAWPKIFFPFLWLSLYLYQPSTLAGNRHGLLDKKAIGVGHLPLAGGPADGFLLGDVELLFLPKVDLPGPLG
jgi:hypothetical protein